MTTYHEAYEERVRAARMFEERKRARRTALEVEVIMELKDQKPKLHNADITFVIMGRAAKDPLLAEHQIMLDRATQQAIMYGIGALIDPTKEVA